MELLFIFAIIFGIIFAMIGSVVIDYLEKAAANRKEVNKIRVDSSKAAPPHPQSFNRVA